MASLIMDTFDYAAKLKAAGCSDALAEAHTRALAEVVVKHLVTQAEFGERDKALTRDITEINACLQRDIEQSRKELTLSIEQTREELKRDIEQLRADVSRDIEQTREELKRDIRESELRLEARLSETRVEMIKWMVGFGIAQTGLIVGLMAKFTHTI